MNKYGRKILLTVVTFILFIAVWQLYVSLSQVPEHVLPGPYLFANEFINILITVDILNHIGITLYEIAVGFFIGAALGLVVGYVLAKNTLLERLFTPYIVLAQTAPKISIAPLFLLWFGLGASSKIALVILVVFFPIMVNFIVGLRSVDKNMTDLLSILDTNRWQRFFSVELPFSMPAIMSGAKAATTYAITGAVIGELIGAKSGLGYLVILGSESYDIDLMLASVLLLSVIGMTLYLLVDFLEKKLLFWHESQETIL